MSWTLDEIPWDRFDRSRLDPEIVKLIKAASLVEYNGAAYAHHLCRIFDDDSDFQESARRWGAEEIQHGNALARWAELANPEFNFEAAFRRFQAGYQVDFDCAISRRGSRSGEMIARCIVEVGTSSYYAALRDAVREPVLKEICRNIAADEIRHYTLFYKNLMRCLERERVGLWGRARVAAKRIAELRMTSSLMPTTPRTRAPHLMIEIATGALMRGVPTQSATSTTSHTAFASYSRPSD